MRAEADGPAATTAAPAVPAGAASRFPGLVDAWLRRALAGAWLRLLMWSAEHAPGLARATRLIFVTGAWCCSPWMRTNLLANARWLLGPGSSASERRRLGRAVLGSFYDFLVDLGRSSRLDDAALQAEIAAVEGHERYQAVRAGRCGAILVTAHLGSFETGLAALRRIEPHVHVLFRRDDQLEAMERLRAAYRRRLGVHEAPVEEGLATWIALRDALREDHVVLLQGDRVLPGQKGIRVPFMGGHRMIPSGPVKLARATGAPIVPIFAPRDPDGRVRIIIGEPITVDAAAPPPGDLDPALRELSAAIEGCLRAHPDQWLMVHRGWCEDGAGDDDAAATEAAA